MFLLWRGGRFQPPLNDVVEGLGVQVVVFVPALPSDREKSHLFQHVQMLRNSLPGQSELGGKPSTQLKQGLAIPFMQCIQNGPPGRGGEGFKEVGHPLSIGKS